MENLVFDITGDWHLYEARCTLNPKYRTFMVYGNEDKPLDHKKNRTYKWKQVQAFNTKDENDRWHAVAKNTEILKAMAAVCGPIALDEAASNHFRKLEGSLVASRAASSDIVIPHPEGMEFYPFQKAGVHYVFEKYEDGNVGAIIADEMGLGKTPMGLGVFNVFPDWSRAIIVCPASLKLNWLRESLKWLNRPSAVVVGNGRPNAETFNEFLDTLQGKTKHEIEVNTENPTNIVLIINYDVLKNWAPMLMQTRFNLCILDEMQLLKNKKTQRTKLTFGYYDKQKKIRVPGLVDVCDKRLGLTGTPLENFPVELYGLVNGIQPGALGKFSTFADRHCAREHNGFGWTMKGGMNLEELQLKLRQRVMVRRRKADVLKEMPAKTRQVIELEGGEELLKLEAELFSKHEDVMSELQAQIDLAFAEGNKNAYKTGVDKLNAAYKVAFTEMAAIRHKLVLAKIPYCLDFITTALENISKVVIFCHHLDALALLKEGLKDYNPVSFSGGDDVNFRQACVDAFQQNPDVRVFLTTIRAGGVGLTLTAAATAIFCELDWKPSAVQQAEDRVHRIGQDLPVNIYHLVFNGSLDGKMAHTLIHKMDMADRALDKDTAIDVSNIRELPVVPRPKGEIMPPKFPNVPNDLKAIVHMGLRELADLCDGARARDGSGFNKFDSHPGKSLAASGSLSDGQAYYGAILVNKYRGQLTEQFSMAAKEVLALKVQEKKAA